MTDPTNTAQLLAALRQFYPDDDDASLLALLEEQGPEQAREQVRAARRVGA